MISARVSRRAIPTLVCSFMSEQESKQGERAGAEHNHNYERRAFHSGKKGMARIGTRTQSVGKVRDASIGERFNRSVDCIFSGAPALDRAAAR